MTTDTLGRLQDLLQDLFQFESKELDFGIYRIMNHKRGEIRRFINEGLPRAVEEALKGGVVAQQAAQAEDLRRKTDRVKETFGEYAIDPKGDLDERYQETPLGKEYLEARSRAGSAVDLEELKATIFNHVYTFFSRYYDNGDFLSKRRYSRRQKYAVPYNGEEVYLHWANADQYYVKTGEHFTDYRYKTNSGITVRFELAAADTEQNNVKGERRFFVPRTENTAYDEDARALTVPFEYRPLTEKGKTAYGTRNQQEKLIEEAAADLPARLKKYPEALAALEPAGELERHLRRYTRRNTSDFFVHKDLKGFLEGELDFYLKNEVLDVDDLEAWGPERSDGWFEVMRVVKRVGRDVISFLAQIEDFQKKLFEKKKLVVFAGYCITLDRVPEELYEEIAASDAQREEWKRLFAIDEIEENLTTPGYSEPLTTDFLKANPHLVLDTKHFDENFKDRLLASIEDLDGQTDGLLIESENFQALNLLQERYREQVKCIYIDPPYNTGNDGFLYKDTYQHSSWLSMLDERLRMGQESLSEDGVIFVSIDDQELPILRSLMEHVMNNGSKIGTIVWKGATDNNPTRIAVEHEYILCFAKNNAKLAPVWKNYNDATKTLMVDKYEELKKQSSSVEEVQRLFRQFIRDNRESLNPLTHYDRVDEDGPYTGGRKVHNPGKEGYRYDVIHPITKKPCKQPARGYRFPESTMRELLAADRVLFGEDETQIIQIKEYLSEYSGSLKSLIELDSRVAANTLEGMFGSRETFRNPKPVQLLDTPFSFTTEQEDTILDFFAGSGTTGHAVIDLNREDGGDRKYILVEMGEYFETVLKPRIIKVIYSKDWRDGKPVSREGTSHAFKYMKLESYEDALDNVAFTHEREGQEALRLYGDDYLLRYMLDFETRGSASLLNVEKLAAPFRYRLKLRDGEEKRSVSVDLPETFAYLLGLRVRTRRVYRDGERRYLVYRGSTPERGEVAAIWRDTEGWDEEDFEHERDFVRENGLAGNADEVFVNGDSFIPEARPLESVFKQRMLAGQAVG